MDDSNKLKNRLLEVINFLLLNGYAKSKKEIADKIGVSASYFTELSKGRNNPTIHKIRSIFIEYPINQDWLLTGEGEMLKESAPQDLTLSPSILVPMLPISAQGGRLNDFVVSVSKAECEWVISPIREADFAITVTGDSMSPEYSNGSQILVKKINEQAFIDWGKVYVLDTCNGTVIKRLMPPSANDKAIVRCVSINPEYPPFEVNLSDVYGVYKVLLCMSIK